MTMTSESPRSTAVGQTETRLPSVTSPRTTAVGWMNAVGSIFPMSLLFCAETRIPRADSREGLGNYSTRLLRQTLAGSARVRGSRREVAAALPMTTDDEHGESEGDQSQFRAHSGPLFLVSAMKNLGLRGKVR